MARRWAPMGTTAGPVTVVIAGVAAVLGGAAALSPAFAPTPWPVDPQPPRAAGSEAPAVLGRRGGAGRSVPSASAGFPRLLAVAGAILAAARLEGRRQQAPAASRKHPVTSAAADSSLQVAAVMPRPIAAAAMGPALLSGERGPSFGQGLSASRGGAAAQRTGRGAKITANYKRHPLGPYAKWRKKYMWLDYAKNFSGRSKKEYKIAQPKVIHKLKARYKSRRLFKRDRRKLWIMRVNSNCKLHGLQYSRFMMKLKEKNININRKILSQLGVYDRGVFTNVLQVADPRWKRRLKKQMKPPKVWTTEELDDKTIPYIEKMVPEIYTDATIRFNRQVKDWGVEYTVDMGEPESWREVLPQMPELANFNLPDHWIGNANAELEGLPLENLPLPPELEHPDYFKFMEQVKQAQEEDKEKEARGEPTWPKKEGVSRDDWFKEEPQTWY